MSLMNCPECSAEMSTKAKFCPKCGHPNDLTQEENKDKSTVHTSVKAPYIIAGLLLIAISVSVMSKGTRKMLNSNSNVNDTTDNNIHGVVFTGDGISTIDNSKFEILESNSSISEDGTYTIIGKVQQKEEKNFSGLFVTFTMYDKNNNKVRSTSMNTSNYLGDKIWEFSATGNDADKIVTSYKLESIYGY